MSCWPRQLRCSRFPFWDRINRGVARDRIADSTGGTVSNRPNFLILMADQLTARALPAYGNRIAKTPHIDALAADGVVFDSFYCNSPLCAPSRFSTLSGRQVSAIGAYDNAAEFPFAGTHICTLSAACRVSDELKRQDAFLRRGSAAWIRGAADHRHLSRRLRLDSGLGAFRTAAELVSLHGFRHPGRSCTRTNQIDFDDDVVFQARQKLFDMARSAIGGRFAWSRP